MSREYAILAAGLAFSFCLQALSLGLTRRRSPIRAAGQPARRRMHSMGGLAFTPEELKKMADAKNQPATNEALLKALDAIGQGHIASNIMWTLLTGFLVMFMQAGFAMVETGFCRAKNAAHVIMTNFMIYPIGMLGYWIAGFALMFGSVAASKIGGPASWAGAARSTGMSFR